MLSVIGSLLAGVARLAWTVVRAHLICLAVIGFFVVCPLPGVYDSPLTMWHPFAGLPTWGAQEIYHDSLANGFTFGDHRDRIVDWSQPPPSFLWNLCEKALNWVEVALPARVVPAPVHLMYLLQGPAKLQVLRTLTLLGVPDLLKDRVLSLRDLHAALLSESHQSRQASILRSGLMSEGGADAVPSFADLPLAKLERLMAFAISIGYFEEATYRGSQLYLHNVQSVVLRTDHPNNLNHLLFHFSNEAFLAWHNLPHAILTPDDSVDAADSEIVARIDAVAGTDTARLWRQGVGESRYTGPLRTEMLGKSIAAGFRRDSEDQLAKLRAADGEGEAPLKSTPGVLSAWEATHGSPLWSFYRKRPALGRNFASAMSQVDVLAQAALVADYEWGTLDMRATNGEVTATVPVKSIVDVAGALGSFLAGVLEAHPVSNATLFDTRETIASAAPLWKRGDPTATYATAAANTVVELVSGDLFDASSLPRPSENGATKYVLRQVLHDWGDAAALRILRNLRTAIGSRTDVALAVVELNRPVGDASPLRAWVDAQMLICCNARERAPHTWVALARTAGWRITATTPTRAMFEVIEMQPSEETSDAHATSVFREEKTNHTERTGAIAESLAAAAGTTPIVAAGVAAIKQEL